MGTSCSGTSQPAATFRLRKDQLYNTPEDEPGIAFNCGLAENLHEWRRDDDMPRPMQIAAPEHLEDDKINPWTRDVVHGPNKGGIAGLPGLASCSANLEKCSGAQTSAPREYMADTPEDATIVLNSRGHCMLKAEGRQSRNLQSEALELEGEARGIKELEESLAKMSLWPPPAAESELSRDYMPGGTPGDTNGKEGLPSYMVGQAR
mmetsp:Transcript_118510/g.221413  ORF Transcript_118510/g.221413 Transcript_118510/m.221413 type:complete len:206 (-) Transcript_118510:83-700(-)